MFGFWRCLKSQRPSLNTKLDPYNKKSLYLKWSSLVQHPKSEWKKFRFWTKKWEPANHGILVVRLSVVGFRSLVFGRWLYVIRPWWIPPLDNRLILIKGQKTLPSTAGMKETQLVIIAPLTTSSSGKTTKTNRARPIVCIDSKIQTTKKSENDDLRADLKMQIRDARNKLPSSGTMKAKHRHQIQATWKK